MRPAFRCGILAFALAVLAGCGQREDGGAGQAQAALAKPSASAAAEPAVARLGALQVAPDELKALLAEVPAETRAQLSENRDAMERWMRARLAEKALYEQASAQDWQQRPQVKTLIDAAARQIVLRTYLESVSTVPEDYPSDAELQAAYQANKAQLAVPALYRVSQIFIAASAAGGLAEARKRAQNSSGRPRTATSPNWRASIPTTRRPPATAATSVGCWRRRNCCRRSVRRWNG